MLEIQFFLFSSASRCSIFSPHVSTHIEVLITDVDSKESYCVAYDRSDNPVIDFAKDKAETITLYIEGSLSEFKKAYEIAFRRGNYDFLRHNCADAANFVLTHFFPEEHKEVSTYYSLYQLVCSIPCISSCGLLTCFPAPPCFSSPRDVFNQACLLTIGKDDKATVVKAAAKDGAAMKASVVAPTPDGLPVPDDMEAALHYRGRP